MDNLLYIGQWQGFFKYGPEYGSIVEGKEAEFRLFIEAYKDGKFSGRIIDWDGFGADGEVSAVEGVVKEDNIIFTKKYDRNFIVDEWGNSGIEEKVSGHKVVYEGRFDKKANHFLGEWKIVSDLSHSRILTHEEVLTGTWQMYRHD